MAKYVCNGAALKCSMGLSPSTLIVIPPTVNTEKKQMANMMDFVPMTNIPPFGMCNTVTNPAVAAATSAALGVLTPAPCIPNIVAPWVGFKTNVLVRKSPALLKNSCLMCLWSGKIEVTSEGQSKVKEA